MRTTHARILDVLIDGERYGAEIARALEMSDIWAGSIYGHLRTLERQGLLTSWEGAPLAVRGGSRRRYYALTDAGRAELRRAV